LGVDVGTHYEAGARDGVVCGVGLRPGGEEVFLWEVEVRVWDSVGGGVFCHWGGGGAEMECVVFPAGLEEEACRNNRGECEGGEEVGEKSYCAGLGLRGNWGWDDYH